MRTSNARTISVDEEADSGGEVLAGRTWRKMEQTTEGEKGSELGVLLVFFLDWTLRKTSLSPEATVRNKDNKLLSAMARNDEKLDLSWTVSKTA